MTSLVVKDLQVDWTQARKHKAKVDRAAPNIVSAGAYALLEEANETVPDDPLTGGDDLKASGFVEVNRGEGHDAFVVGYSAPYALRQHEKTEYHHQGRGRAKWLELTALERDAQARVRDEMADEARKELD